MPKVSTTLLRELSMQISRLVDQFSNYDEKYDDVVAGLESVLVSVDSLIDDIVGVGPTA